MSSHSHLSRERFRFQSQALLDENAMRVVRFTGTEGLSTLYRFEIVLATHKDEVISTFSLNISPLPRQVVLRDYDSNRPNAPVVASATVAPHGLGTVYCYGEGSVPTLRPGRNFTLKDHYDESCNRDYTAKKGITLTATDGDCKLDTKTTTISASSEIKLDSDTIILGKTNKLKLDQSGWKADATGTLTLTGTMVKIN